MANPGGYPARCDMWCTDLFRVKPSMRGGIVPDDDTGDASCIPWPNTPSYHARCVPEPAPPCEHIPFIEKRGYTPAPMDALHLSFQASRKDLRLRGDEVKPRFRCHPKSVTDYPRPWRISYSDSNEETDEAGTTREKAVQEAKKTEARSQQRNVTTATTGIQTEAVVESKEDAGFQSTVTQTTAAQLDSSTKSGLQGCERDEVNVLTQTDAALRYFRAEQARLDAKYGVGSRFMLRCSCVCTCPCTCPPYKRRQYAALQEAEQQSRRGGLVAEDKCRECVCVCRDRVMSDGACAVCGLPQLVPAPYRYEVTDADREAVRQQALVCPGISVGQQYQRPLPVYHPKVTVQLCELMTSELQRQQAVMREQLGMVHSHKQPHFVSQSFPHRY